MSLAAFKGIFWLEWTHRLWGRLIGLVFLVPLVVFAIRGAISRRMIPRLLVIFAIGALQGVVGWFMVSSGFAADSTEGVALPAGHPSGPGHEPVRGGVLDRTFHA